MTSEADADDPGVLPESPSASGPLPASEDERDLTTLPVDSLPGRLHGRPAEAQPWPLETGLKSPQTMRLHARKALDGTLWCAHCNRTLDPSKAMAIRCRFCEKERHRLRNQKDLKDIRTVDYAVLERVLEAASRMQQEFALAYAPWGNGGGQVDPEALEAFFRGAKNMIEQAGVLKRAVRTGGQTDRRPGPPRLVSGRPTPPTEPVARVPGNRTSSRTGRESDSE